jgi:hypothetical protein
MVQELEPLLERMFTAVACLWLWGPTLTVSAMLEAAAAVYLATQKSAIQATPSTAAP